ncbi:MAG: AAA family ATPase [Ruminococcus sp.]|nr:AAA family ATPase [Ruminococcus sp.]
MNTDKKISFSISFNPAWVLSKREDMVLPIDRFTFELKKKYEVTKLDASLTDCSGVIDIPDDSNPAVMQKEIEDMLAQLYHLEADSKVYTLTVDEYDEPEEEAKPADELPSVEEIIASETTSKIKEKIETKKPEIKDETLSAMERIKDLVGASEFKEIAEECVRIAPYIQKHGTFDAFTHRSYLVSVNDGYGLSTYLNLFADLIEEHGLFKFASKKRVTEVALLPPQTKNPMESPFSSALSCFQKSSGGKIVCIDISEWMSNTDDKEFRDFLKTIDLHAGENIVFFRVPFVEKNILLELHNNLNDQLFVKDFSIIPFDSQELDVCAQALLTEMGFTAEADAWDVFRQRITEEKNDGRFYGINTVRKVILEMIYLKQLHDAGSGNDDSVIRKEEILDLISFSTGLNQTGMQMLSELVGMEAIQQRVEEIIAQIETSMHNESLGSPCIHMRFVGNPGTGKTTVARIIGKILKEKGILRNGNFFEYSGRDFCGRYVGETAPKTASMCRDAYGSVLFIDEAYSLYRADSFSTADYGREAIDTLVAEMENHRTDLMVIMAGYPDEMEKLMTGNVGLKSRMPYQIDFPNYSREQLAQIFLGMVKKSFTYQSDFENAVKDYFNNLSDELMNAKEFSNARFARNLFERTWGKAVLRCQMAQKKCTALAVEDFRLATAEKEFQNIMQKKNKPIGFI